MTTPKYKVLVVATGVATYYENRTTKDLFRRERSLHKIYGYIAGARTKMFVNLVSRHVFVDISSIVHTDYLEVTPCVKWSLTTNVKNEGTL